MSSILGILNLKMRIYFRRDKISCIAIGPYLIKSLLIIIFFPFAKDPIIATINSLISKYNQNLKNINQIIHRNYLKDF